MVIQDIKRGHFTHVEGDGLKRLLTAVVFGHQINSGDLQELIDRGADRVVAMEAARLEHFETEPEEDEDGWLHMRYGALQPLSLRIVSRSELHVETTSDTNVGPNIAQDSIRRYNRFLEAATGFNTKQRSKRLQKKAKDGTM